MEIDLEWLEAVARDDGDEEAHRDWEVFLSFASDPAITEASILYAVAIYAKLGRKYTDSSEVMRVAQAFVDGYKTVRQDRLESNEPRITVL